LQQVRQEHGPDAVILSNRMTDAGIEIVAASNYEQDDVLQILTESSPAEANSAEALTEADVADASGAAVSLADSANAAPPHQAVPVLADAAQADASPLLSTPSSAAPVAQLRPQPPAAASRAMELPELRAELAQMREMFQRQMERLTDQRLRGVPVCYEIMEWMDARGFDAGLTREIAQQIPADLDPQQAHERMLELLANALPTCPADPLEVGGVIALVGPAGVGKTTTLGKLAAHYSARHSTRDVAIITTDVQRTGRGDLLCQYGRRLGIAVHEVDAGTDLNTLVQRVKDYPLVLMDTAGLARRDRTLAGQINWLCSAQPVHTLLVLAANTHPADLDEAIRRFQPLNPQGAILTRLDETSRLGGALSALAGQQLPLAWLADGQRLHDDLHRASATNVLLRLNEHHSGDGAERDAVLDRQRLAA